MKIYASNNNKLTEFVGEDVWVLFDVMGVSDYDYGGYLKILSVDNDGITYVPAVDTSTLQFMQYWDEIDSDSYNRIYSKITDSNHNMCYRTIKEFNRTYRLHTPLDVYSSEELLDLIGSVDVLDMVECDEDDE
jgi:hypothetical protein